jgi:transposase
MSRTWLGSDWGKQPALVAMDARALLPPGHAAFGFLEAVQQLDMSAFQVPYRDDGRGRPPFDPRVMLALILYCRSTGIMSGRAVAAACYDDLGARMITGNRYPDRSTVDRFIGTHRTATEGLLAQTLRLGHAAGLVDLSIVAGDGTYLLANAAMSATVDEATLLAQIAALEQQLAAAEAAWLDDVGADTDAAMTLFGDDDEPRRCWREDAKARRRVQAHYGRLRAYKTALAYLRSHPNSATADWEDRLRSDRARVVRWADRLDLARADAQASIDRRNGALTTGASWPGTRPGSVDDYIRVRQAKKALDTAIARAETTAAARPTTNRVNTTDPVSKIMPGKNDGFDQRHNLQVLACPNQFIVAITTHNNTTDKQALLPLLNRSRANLDAAGITDPIRTALFDNGYASEANFTADLPVKLLLIAVEKEARQTQRRRDNISTAAATWNIMATQFDNPDHRTVYKRRGAIVEPVFAQLFNRFGRAINYRGEAVATELHLWAATHNILKIIHAGHKTRPT